MDLDLEDDDRKKLKDAKIWSKEDSQINIIDDINQYFIAKDLIVPSDLYREFGLPIIKWTEVWVRNTKEGKYIVNLC